MGWAKCTYRNCTMKSDGQTHFFHYPVFDKARCHQWLINAQRLDFLNLKVSQLKNRVVCQHHFKDEEFMNYKKERIMFHAVPTIDGPYCDSSKIDIDDISDTTLLPITVEDMSVESDSISDKKAFYSMKYADYFTCNDMTDYGILEMDMWGQVKRKEEVNVTNAVEFYPNAEPITVRDIKILNSIDMNNPYCMSTHNTPNSEVTIKEVTTKDDREILQFSNSNNVGNSNIFEIELTPITNLEKPKTNKVKILSQKKITEPFPVVGQFEPVSPFSVIQVLKKGREKLNQLPDNNIKKPKENEALKKSGEVFENIIAPSVKQEVNLPTGDGVGNSKIKNESENQAINAPKPKVSLLKNKLPPERVAAIEEKRKFNMKLKDVLEAGLNQLEELDNKQELLKSKPPASLKPNKMKTSKPDKWPEVKVIENNKMLETENNNNNPTKYKTDKNKKVVSFLSKEESLPSSQENFIGYMEARIKKMESILTNKIDQNSQRILDLKNSVASTSHKQYSSRSTQTVRAEKTKKELYHEISKYLSPEAKSLIYEELFINQDIIVPEHLANPKKRRNR